MEKILSEINYASLAETMYDSLVSSNLSWKALNLSDYNGTRNPILDLKDSIMKEFNLPSNKSMLTKRFKGTESDYNTSIEIYVDIYAKLEERDLAIICYTPNCDSCEFDLEYGNNEGKPWDEEKFKKWQLAMFLTKILKSIHIKKISPKTDVIFVWIAKPDMLSDIERIKLLVKNMSVTKEDACTLFYKELIKNDLINSRDPYSYKTDDVMTEPSSDIDFDKEIQLFEKGILVGEDKDELVYGVWKAR